MYYSDDIVEQVRRSVDIVDIISQYVLLKPKGTGYVGLCPFHNEKTGSFSVNQRGQYYNCFGCHKGGTVFNFLCDYEHMTYPEAIRYVADKGGVKLPEQEETPEMRAQRSKKEILLDINKEAATYYYKCLRVEQGALGMKYFVDRGLSPETMKSFGLGYAPQSTGGLYKYLKSLNYSDSILNDSGLFTFSEKYGFSDKFFNRVIFPIFNQSHKVIGFGGRVMGKGEPKYLNSPETPIFHKFENLYALDVARTTRKNHIIMCEGYMDVISLHQAGFTEAAASLGTAFTTQHAMLLKRYTKTVLLAYDSDKAGVTAALKNIKTLRSVGLNSRIINLEPCKDPDEFIKTYGPDEFQKRIDDAENSFLFEIRKLRDNYKLNDPDGQTAFQDKVAQKLLVFRDEMERDNYLEAVARTYEINPDMLRKKVYKYADSYVPKETEETDNNYTKLQSGKEYLKKIEDPVKKMQRYLLTEIVEVPERYTRISDILSADDFTDPMYHSVAEKLFEQIKNNAIDPAGIICSFEDSDEQSEVALIFSTKIEDIVTEEQEKKAFKDVVIAVKTNALSFYSSKLGSDVNALKSVVAAKQSLEKLKNTNIDW